MNWLFLLLILFTAGCRASNAQVSDKGVNTDVIVVLNARGEPCYCYQVDRSRHQVVETGTAISGYWWHTDDVIFEVPQPVLYGRFTAGNAEAAAKVESMLGIELAKCVDGPYVR